MVESFAGNSVSHFHSPQTGEEESKLLQRSISKSTTYKTQWAIKIFKEWQINRKVKVPVLDAGGAFKDYGDLCKVQLFSTDLANMHANTLNYWLSKFVQEVANSEGKVYPARSTSFNLHIFYCRLAIFRHCLDAKMNDSMWKGVSLQTKTEEKKVVTDEDEEKF